METDLADLADLADHVCMQRSVPSTAEPLGPAPAEPEAIRTGGGGNNLGSRGELGGVRQVRLAVIGPLRRRNLPPVWNL
jgi:hypothetical protein